MWGATAAATVGGVLESRDENASRLFSEARRLYGLCESDGPFANEAGLLAEQVFDNGDLDSATPIAWAHALRVDATATLARHGALPVPHDRRGRRFPATPVVSPGPAGLCRRRCQPWA